MNPGYHRSRVLWQQRTKSLALVDRIGTTGASPVGQMNERAARKGRLVADEKVELAA